VARLRRRSPGNSLTLWKKDYLGHVKPAQLDGEQMSPEQMLEKILQQQKEIEYLKRQREILKKAARRCLVWLIG
jgi:hypothetical protein